VSQPQASVIAHPTACFVENVMLPPRVGGR
jgi:hypothetical protein